MAEPTYREDALNLYSPPFRYEHGFIWDSQNNVVADEPGGHYGEDAALRVRGWGRISYKPDPDKLQDAVGRLMAEALTAFWLSRKQQS